MSGPTLTEFLLARISEDESDWRAVDAREVVQLLHGRPLAPRMLAECAAKRRIVELHAPQDWGRNATGNLYCDTCARWEDVDWDGPPLVDWPCPTLRLLALPYADHSEWREEWRP